MSKIKIVGYRPKTLFKGWRVFSIFSSRKEIQRLYPALEDSEIQKVEVRDVD